MNTKRFAWIALAMMLVVACVMPLAAKAEDGATSATNVTIAAGGKSWSGYQTQIEAPAVVSQDPVEVTVSVPDGYEAQYMVLQTPPEVYDIDFLAQGTEEEYIDNSWSVLQGGSVWVEAGTKTVYVRVTNDSGSTYSYASSGSIVVDNDEPYISVGNSAYSPCIDGATYGPEEPYFWLVDSAPKSVTVNGEDVEIQQWKTWSFYNRYAINLCGFTGECTLVITDYAGNSRTYRINVAASNDEAEAKREYTDDGLLYKLDDGGSALKTDDSITYYDADGNVTKSEKYENGYLVEEGSDGDYDGPVTSMTTETVDNGDGTFTDIVKFYTTETKEELIQTQIADYTFDDNGDYVLLKNVYMDGDSNILSVVELRDGILWADYYKDGKLYVSVKNEYDEELDKTIGHYYNPDGSLYAISTMAVNGIGGSTDPSTDKVITYKNGEPYATVTYSDGKWVGVSSDATVSATSAGLDLQYSDADIVKTVKNGDTYKAHYDVDGKKLVITKTTPDGVAITYEGVLENGWDVESAGVSDNIQLVSGTVQGAKVAFTVLELGPVIDAEFTFPGDSVETPAAAPTMVVTTPVYDGTKSVEFHSSDDLENFIAVFVDGNKVDAADYDVSKGSIKVVLHDDYLKKLGPGKHTIGIQSTNGTATGEFTLPENVDELVDKASDTTQKPVTSTETTDEKTQTPSVSTEKESGVEPMPASDKKDVSTSTVKPVATSALPDTFDASATIQVVATVGVCGAACIAAGLRKRV
jgi:hypothetical protein